MQDKWYEKFISQDENGYIAWDETQTDAIGYYATKREAILALVEYSKRFHGKREDRLNVETK